MDAWFWVWVVFAVVLSAAEIFTAGFFLLPIGIGAGVAAVVNYFGFSTGIQWFAFLASSVVLFYLMHGLADRLTHEPPQKMGADRLIGKRGLVIESLVPHSPLGIVRVEREEWRAETVDDTPVAEGNRVEVLGIEGSHLIVAAVDDASAS